MRIRVPSRAALTMAATLWIVLQTSIRLWKSDYIAWKEQRIETDREQYIIEDFVRLRSRTISFITKSKCPHGQNALTTSRTRFKFYAVQNLAFVTWRSNSNQLLAGKCRSLESAKKLSVSLGVCSIMQDLQINGAFHRDVSGDLLPVVLLMTGIEDEKDT